MSFTYEYPRPAVTVDAVVYGYQAEELRVLLIERGEAPFRGAWALPGGFLNKDEDLGDAVQRELLEETGVAPTHLEQLGSWGTPGRDPRGHTVTVAYTALVRMSDHQATAATDAADARWFPVDGLPGLAFDHGEILDAARARLVESVRTRPVGFDLLPDRFTLTQLQSLVETVLGEALDKRNFRKKLQSLDMLISTGEFEKDVSHRAAQLYRFDRAMYEKLSAEGFQFRL
jgi:8-oxo-dGTP diphosphatase